MQFQMETECAPQGCCYPESSVEDLLGLGGSLEAGCKLNPYKAATGGAVC